MVLFLLVAAAFLSVREACRAWPDLVQHPYSTPVSLPFKTLVAIKSGACLRERAPKKSWRSWHLHPRCVVTRGRETKDGAKFPKPKTKKDSLARIQSQLTDRVVDTRAWAARGKTLSADKPPQWRHQCMFRVVQHSLVCGLCVCCVAYGGTAPVLTCTCVSVPMYFVSQNATERVFEGKSTRTRPSLCDKSHRKPAPLLSVAARSLCRAAARLAWRPRYTCGPIS